jgi:GT2 family glycosyltransferase
MISAIVVNHNGEATLDRCLHSLDRADAETLLVDNNSHDGSLTLVRERFPEVVLMPQARNLGFAAANNLAAERAAGDNLLLLNSDAWLQPDALDRLITYLDQHPRVGLVAPRLHYPDGRRQFSWSPARGIVGEAIQKVRNRFEPRSWVHGSTARMLSRLVGRRWFTAACVLVRAEAWRSVGGFDERFFMYFEDVDLCVRLEKAGWRLAEEPRAAACHVGGVAIGKRVDDLYRPSQLRYYRLHRPAWEQQLIERRLRRRFGDEAVDRWMVGGA